MTNSTARVYAAAAVLTAAVAFAQSASAAQCGKCGAVAPVGWTLCQRCRNEQERLEREEARKKRAEARRQKEAAEKEAKLKKLIDEQTRPPEIGDASVGSSSTTSVHASSAALAGSEAGHSRDAFPGLFGIKFGQRPGPDFAAKTVMEDGRFVERRFFSPAKRFRGFDKYSVRSSAKDGVYEIKAHLRFERSATVDAKLAANTEYDDCAALLAKKFGARMTPTEESLNARAAQIGFTTPDGIVGRTLLIRVERNLDAARAAAADPANAASAALLEAAMDSVWDVTITATDLIPLLRDQRLQEAEDLDAL